jgi:apolipoprotein D and lipocalin family protein
MSSIPLPSGPQPPVEPLSLDERIRRAELRLIAREDGLRRRIDLLGRRLREATRPQRFIAPAIGVAVVLLALGVLLRGRARPLAARAAASHAAAGAPAFAGNAPWVRLIALAWPLVPAAWRARISPTTAAAVVTIGLPLAERLLAERRHAPLPVAAQVDLARFAGTWHEIARLPTTFDERCDTQPSVQYAWHGDQLEVINRCIDRHGHPRVRRGIAHIVPDSGNAKLEVSTSPPWLQWLPLARGQHWVLHVDDDYQSAVVGDPQRRHLWILSRSRQMAPEPLSALVQFAHGLQFPVERLQIVQPG